MRKISVIYVQNNGFQYLYNYLESKCNCENLYNVGSSTPSLYCTWYPKKYFGITTEASFGSLLESDYFGYMGIKFLILFNTSKAYTPFISLGASYSFLSISKDKSRELLGIGPGLGYYINFGSKFNIKVEAQYKYLPSVGIQRGRAQVLSILISLGTFFSGY